MATDKTLINGRSPSRQDVKMSSKLELDSHMTQQVVVPVEGSDLSMDTFLWYLQNLHKSSKFVHVMHVPDFRSHVHSNMTPMQVMEVMIATNTESDRLKRAYESIIKERKIEGKFMRVGGNSRCSAIKQYCKLVKADLLVLGTRPLPDDIPPPSAKPSANLPESDSSRRRSSASSRFSLTEIELYDNGPHPGTVTFEILLDIDIPVAVYRKTLNDNESQDTQQKWQARRNSIKQT